MGASTVGLAMRCGCKELIRAAAVMGMVAFAATAHAEGPLVGSKRMEEGVLTIRGRFEVYRLALANGREKNQITLDGKVLDEPGYEVISIAASYPEKGPARVVLLELTTGGSGCPAFYQVVEIKEDGSVLRSEEFGNCSPKARPSFTRGVLRIDLPRIAGATAESWRYQDGMLSIVPASPSNRAW